MTARRAYPAVDRFRIVAALLVVCIHTAPLEGVGETADFTLRTLARLAVPFFFTATGFFVLGPSFCPGGRTAKLPPAVCRFLKRTGALYAGATLAYLPIAIYSGNIPQKDLPFSLFRWLIWDGSFYHLWYLPAVMLGVLIVWALSHLPVWGGAAICGVLYVVGVLGDSWHGLALQAPALRAFYGSLFARMDYTRTGLFFAPVFLFVGALLASRPRPARRASGFGLMASLALLLIEAFAVRALNWPRFDAMYLSLIPCSCFLFALLLLPQGRGGAFWRTWSMLVYLAHPLMIVVVRGAAKLLRAEPLLIQNALIHFLTVAALSACLSALLSVLTAWHRRRTPRPYDIRTARAWAEVDLDALAYNAAALRACLPKGCQLMPVVKADAYGHGAAAAAGRLWREGVRAFAVATLEEGAALRRSGIGGEILILGYTDAARVPELVRWRLSQTISSEAHAQALCAAAQGRTVDVHIAVDTGMHRLGIDASDTLAFAHLMQVPELCVRGLFTHLCDAENLTPASQNCTNAQLAAMASLIDALRASGCAIPPVHVQASGGILNLPNVRCAYARPGLALYGAYAAASRLTPPLRPALALRARVVCTHILHPGESAGYAHAFTAQRETLLAVAAIGYADGWPRAAGEGRGCALLHGQRVPIVGRVCMDQLLLDATETGASPGDIITLIGADASACITAAEAADRAGTIPNELLTRISARVPRIYDAPKAPPLESASVPLDRPEALPLDSATL